MSTTTEPKQDRSRATRQRLLEAAVTCLATKGWEASTVSKRRRRVVATWADQLADALKVTH